MGNIPSDAFILLAVYSDYRSKTYGLVAMERRGILRESWALLFAMAAKGTVENGVAKAVEFLEWGANLGAIVTSGHDNVSADGVPALNHEYVRGHIELPIFKNTPIDPAAEDAYWRAQTAWLTVFPDHDFVKQQTAKATDAR